MEAIQELNLTQLQLKQLNACRMHLQVTTLAEIVDHTGMQLLLLLVPLLVEKPQDCTPSAQPP